MGNKNKKKNNAAAVTEKDAKNNDGKKVITDERFKKMHTDPRFQKVPKHKAKVAIDSRFSAMFTDKRFATSSAPLDKRGKLKKGSSEAALRRYYRMEEEEDGGEEKKRNIRGKEKEGDEERGNGKSAMEDKESEESDDSDAAESESGDESDLPKSKSKVVVDDDEEDSEDNFVDGDSSEEEMDVESDATSSTTDTDEERDADLEDDDDSVEVENVPTIEKETHRLAIVNMDWGQVKADDLFVMLSSFLPKGGQILSVSVYPSEFGLKRMEEEAVHGPAALFNGEEENSDNDSDDDDEIDTEKLRAYERSKLRYYYGVVVCDSVATADYLYKSCDGAEFERSSNVLDMRFIPDDLEFKHPPRDQATEAPADYEGLDFHTRALQHSNVHLSWDEDEPHRAKTLNRKFNTDQLADLELKEFLASDESESEEDADETEDLSERKNKKWEKYRSLIQSGNGSEEEEEDERQDMEVTFSTDLENISKKILERKDAKVESVWEKHLKSRKEKKKARKNRSKGSSDDDNDYSSDDASVEEPDDFFEEKPPPKKTKKSVSGKKKSGIESVETEVEGVASVAELELLLADDDKPENKVKRYKMKPDKMKRKKGKKEALVEDTLPDVDLSDPRFAASLKNPSFALDPTDPQYKRSMASARRLLQQGQKGREEVFEEDMSNINKKSGSESFNKQENDDDEQSKSDKKPSKDKHELAMLVKSVKMKSKQVPLQSNNGKMNGSSGKKRKHNH